MSPAKKKGRPLTELERARRELAGCHGTMKRLCAVLGCMPLAEESAKTKLDEYCNQVQKRRVSYECRDLHQV